LLPSISLTRPGFGRRPAVATAGFAQRKVCDCLVVLTGEPEQRRPIGRREGDHGPVRRDDRAVILGPAALAECGAIEAEHGRKIERRLDVSRPDEGRILRGHQAPPVGERQTHVFGHFALEGSACGPCQHRDGVAEQALTEIVRGATVPDRPPGLVDIVV
jgi:hypothetical protein